MPARPAWYAWFYLALVAVMAFGGTVLASILAGRDADPATGWLLKCTLVLALVCGLTRQFLRRDGLSWSRYGICRDRSAARLSLVGLAGGLVLVLGWSGVVAACAPFHWRMNPTFSVPALLSASLATVAIGIAEEVGYRSYGMERFHARYGPGAAALVPTLVFAAAHLSGGMGVLPAVLVVGSAGLMYASLMLATRSLPFVAAFHIANNLGQDALLRTGAGSLWTPEFRDPLGAESNAAWIWVGMAAINLAVAAFAWRRRFHYSEVAPEA